MKPRRPHLTSAVLGARPSIASALETCERLVASSDVSYIGFASNAYPHKATQCPLIGPATENRLILANMTMPDNIAGSVRRGQNQWRPQKRIRELPIKDQRRSAEVRDSADRAADHRASDWKGWGQDG
jgi:hypothetical protein